MDTKETEKEEEKKNQSAHKDDSNQTVNAEEQKKDDASLEDGVPEEKSDSAEKAQNGENAEEKLPEDKIQELQKKIDSLTAENADLKDQVLRRAADFDNYRKRTIQEKQDLVDYGIANLLKDLLDSLDNFDRTVEAAANATDPKAIADGVKMINKGLVSMLENKYNLVSYGNAGDSFDPSLHEAIGIQEGDVPEEQLAAVYLKGYKLKDKIIRHAKVMVVKPKADDDKKDAEK